MGTAEMVGSIGLTFFCNRCVESLYDFKKSGVVSDELARLCKEAIAALRSLDWSKVEPEGVERIALFQTNEEVRSLKGVLRDFKWKDARDALDELIPELQIILKEERTQEERKRVAGKLQQFFNTLGNYSFYATRDCVRTLGNFAGV